MGFNIFKLALFEIEFSVVSSSSTWKMLPLLGKMSSEQNSTPLSSPFSCLEPVQPEPTLNRIMGAVPTDKVCEVTMDDPSGAVERCFPLTQTLTMLGAL